MASNPFDQFADDFRAAIPGAPPKSSEPVLTMGPPAPAPAPKPSGPPMNAPPIMSNPYGHPPQPPGGVAPYGGAPQQPPPFGMVPAAPGVMGGPPPPGAPGAYPPPLNNGLGGGMAMGGGMGMAMVPAAQQSNPYALGAPQPPMGANPYGAPPAFSGPPPAGLPQPPPAPAAPQPPAAPVPPPPPPQPVQASPQPPANAGFGGLFDPMGPPAPPAPADPWGAAPTQPPPPPAPPVVPASPPAPTAAPVAGGMDPFGGIFGSPSPPAPAAPVPAPPPANSNPWGDMGFGTAPPAPPAPYQPAGDDTSTLGGGTISDMRPSGPTTVPPEADFFSSGPPPTQPPQPAVGGSGPIPPAPKKNSLPEGGEYFDARIFTPTLGVMFFKPQELTDSLFLNTDRSIVDALEERPTVAFIVEGSSARSAGVELGNVLLKVNGIDVKNPKEASRLIKEGPRPLPLLFYVPSTTVVVAEGEHMVKYDTRETGAPLSAKDWKPKYVVIGGIIAQPWMMNMYRSKAEYDIAVIETQARRPVSVKVKQFSLQGARIQNDWQGPQMVKYKNKLHPWKFIVVLPVSRNPIKISSSNLSQLKPVHEGIRRVLMAQQRGNSAHIQGPTAGPVTTDDPYQNGGGRGNVTEGGVGSVRRKTAY